MSIIALKAGYHQVKMYTPDMDKTAFVCPFGVYRLTRMPFGLKTAQAIFQRLIDFFRNGLKVNMLAYLDDLNIMPPPTFEQHLEDLRLVFKRLQQFKLQENREKCHFMCQKVKCLGYLITRSGIEVDPVKVAAIMDIPPPKNVKQLQKRATWTWSSEEQNSFDTLKKGLISPPVLKQLNENKPFILRTDASAYTLGAVCVKTKVPDNTQSSTPVVFLYRLKEIEGAEIRVVSDHQPLKWLLSLKTPTGRLARWALQIQSFNLKFEYVPGKPNVMADMLSRPACNHVYCSQANPVERKNGPHTTWAEKLPVIRFSMNSAKCSSTRYSVSFLQFGREMSTADDVKHDLLSVIHNADSYTFVAEITPYLRKFANLHQEIKDRVEKKQDQRKEYADNKRRNAVSYAPGDRVWVTTNKKSK
ncbi:Retrovirus-related Pol polyprotein like [Argiope bruennichi]|uniref:Retrovirus-related Pol polyprotein like n=1 Tax=Argiope bruennichi TaxID=94029 RepID=A0A8T0FXG2_ARGBR|nr:Retrovirus-related Pol polyprotein like [Argiope bruennichi]